MKIFHDVKRCRICNSQNLVCYLDLGEIPLANNFPKKNEIKKEKKFPLQILLCKDCYFSQLSIVVNPKILFQNYVYISQCAGTFITHCQELAEELNKEIMREKDLIIDIGSNDGSLLKQFEKWGNIMLGIDPAKNLARQSNKEGIKTIPKFWSKNLAEKLLKKYGKAKVITAFNVFAHVDDIHSFLDGVKTILKQDGYLIIQSPHTLPLINNIEFDTVYHEHLSYLTIKPLIRLMAEHGFRIAKIKELDIHGGSIRIYVEFDNQNTSDGSVEKLIEKETKNGLYTLERYFEFQKQVGEVKQNLTKELSKPERFLISAHLTPSSEYRISIPVCFLSSLISITYLES